jgi:hypothetical protein
MPNKEEYLNEVCRQIKFRAARKYLRQELAAHIDDKKEEYLKGAAEEAEAKAVASMGDAAETGRALNAVHKPRMEWGVVACVLALTIAGFIIIWLTQTDDIYFTSGWRLRQQFSTFITGLCLMAAVYFFNYTYIVRLRYAFYAAALLLVAYYAVFSGNVAAFSGLSYVSPIFDFVFLQAPVIILSTLLFMLGIFGSLGRIKSCNISGLLPAVGLCALSMAVFKLVFGQLYAVMLAVVCLASLGAIVFKMQRKWHMRVLCLLVPAIIFAAVPVLVTILRMNEPLYRYLGVAPFGGVENSGEITRMFEGSKLVGASPYYLEWQSRGLHASSTDFLLTSIIARYGWLAGAGFILVFGALLFFLFFRSLRLAHTPGKAIALGISAYLLLRFAIFALTNTGLVSGVSCGLPFVSYGRFDYIACSLLVGLFLSVWRRSTFMKDEIGRASCRERV